MVPLLQSILADGALQCDLNNSYSTLFRSTHQDCPTTPLKYATQNPFFCQSTPTKQLHYEHTMELNQLPRSLMLAPRTGKRKPRLCSGQDGAFVAEHTG